MTHPMLPEMKAGWVISAIVHAALLAWGLVSFAARPLEAKPTNALPVDIVSTSEFSQLTTGQRNAKKPDEPKPLVDKVGEQKPADDATPKVADKPEIKTAAAPPQAPEPAKPEPTKPAPPKPPEKKPEPKVDPIADKLKREEQQKKIADAKAKAEAKKKQEQQPKFDANQIAALLDQRAPQRTTATGQTPVSTPSLGFANAAPAQISQTELDALRRRLQECWNVPVGAAHAGKIKVVLRILFKPDGSISAPPELVAATPSPYGPAMAESAKRAILTCQPFTMLKPENYRHWKDVEITFDPHEMFGG